MRILHLEFENYDLDTIQKLEKVGTITTFNPQFNEELKAHLERNQYDVLFVSIGFMLSEEILKLQNNLNYIVSPTTGLNHIDLDYCQKNKIKVLSLKGEAQFLNCITSTAEHTWALLLSLVRNITSSTEHVKNGGWDRTLFMGTELYQKTIGIIGYGRLGKMIAIYAESFGMQVLINDVIEFNKKEIENIEQTDFESLIKNSDVIVLMASWSKENENLISKSVFNKMKKGAIFINTSRGEMVDEQALLESLVNKNIKGAALDVLKDDSTWRRDVSINHPLIKYAKNNHNLIITPHIGGYGVSSIFVTRQFIVNKFLKEL